MNRKRLIIIGSVILACFFIFLIIGKSTATTYESLEKELISAIEEKDSTKFLNLFDSSKKKLNYSSIGAKSILEDWNGKLKGNTALIMEILDPKGSQYAEIDADAKYHVTIKTKTHWLFFKNYYLDTNASKIKLDKTAKEETIYLKGKKLSADEFKNEFFPGIYEFSASKKFEYTTVEDSKSIKVDGKGEEKELAFLFEGTTVKIPEGPESLFVTFNGKETKMHLKPKETQDFGPISEDDLDKVAISGKLPLISEVGKTAIGDENSIYTYYNRTEFENTKFDSQKLSDEMNSFIKSEFTAFKSRKISDIKNVTNNFITNNKEKYTEEIAFFSPEHRENTLKAVYYDKETPKLYINDDGELEMTIEGIILSNNSKESDELVEDLIMELLYVEKEDKWLINDYSCGGSIYRDMPSENAIDSYIVTKY
ncbi:hypothetical protein HCB45_14220 [Listeria sp. FSL L7-0091]|uniref:hypothetical protein n=1 Tax=Listeria farberi TaxID=2713500 RepID=UPI001629C3A4|nr:hypothetical protein [Listeria farberi]MBC2262714.1 hypothetical protein [Listeria farberi]